jgi:hypothetical protein
MEKVKNKITKDEIANLSKQNVKVLLYEITLMDNYNIICNTSCDLNTDK